jgi:methyl-accepting chemotaxis protein
VRVAHGSGVAAACAACGGLALGVCAGGFGWPAGLAVLGVATAMVGLATQASARARAARIAELEAVLDALSAGVRPRPLEGAFPAELAGLASAARRAGDAAAAATARSSALGARLAQGADRLGEVLEAARRATAAQEANALATAPEQQHVGSSIGSIHSEIESLARSNESVASCVLELVTAVEQVTGSAARLQQTVESSTTSIHQMGQSIQLAAESGDSVQQMAEETAASMSEMDRALQEVGLHVRGASDLTRRVSESAEEGSRAVGATIEGIEEIRQLTSDARTVLEGLVRRIGEIGEIATVIGGITDEANLLSLNAAIIAAQAGEHGKAFAVVADQVKTLARRTTQSTREIEQRIRAIQEQSQAATQAMEKGIEAVEQGVARSRRAGHSLEVIRSSASDASGRVAGIARATEEQARNSKHVAEAARRTSEHVHQISHAMSEQSAAAQQLLRNAVQAVDMCRQMTSATEEQRSSGRYIQTNIESITDMIHAIQLATSAHERASAAVAAAVEAILGSARESGARLPQLEATVAELRACAEALAQERPSA